MAGSHTVTSPPFAPIPPKSPNFNFTVPNADKTKTAPWEGLLMGDPGPDYDQRENRKSLLRFMLELGKRDGKGRKMANWRDNQVLFFHPDDAEEIMQAEDVGKIDAMRLADAGQEKAVAKDEGKEEKETRWGMDDDAMCWEPTTKKDEVKEKKDSKTEIIETSFGADEPWTTSRVTLS